MARRFGMLALALWAGFAWADGATLEKYKAEAAPIVRELADFTTRDLAVLHRSTAWKTVETLRKSYALLNRVAAETALTDDEKSELVFLVGDAGGALVERFADGFVDAKWKERTYGQLRAEGYSVVGASLALVRDWFVKREVEPYRFRDRERAENPWVDYLVFTPGAAFRALFDRVVRLFPGALREVTRVLVPGQRIEGEWQWTVPPGLPFVGSDAVRYRAGKTIAEDIRKVLEEAAKDEKNHWAIAALVPFLAHVKNAEPFRLQWTHRSMRRWYFFAALWLFCNPVELTRHEMSGIEYATLETLFMLASARLRRTSSGIDMYWILNPVIEELEKAGKIDSCAALLGGRAPKPAPTNAAARNRR